MIGGHGRTFTTQWVAAQRDYLRTLWDAARSAQSAGRSCAELVAGLPYDDLFSGVAGRIRATPDDLAARHADILS